MHTGRWGDGMTDLREKKKLPATKKEKLYLALIPAVVLVIALVLLLYPRSGRDAAEESPAENAAEGTVITKEVEKIVEVEKTVTVETLEQGLNDMGVLITEEYYFTDLMSFSSIKRFLKTDYVLPFTESSYLVSYDGAVNAGLDLGAARIEKDDDQMRITVHIPKASIQTVNIDLNSFQLREEKNGIGNRLSVQDFNTSLQELEDGARQKALERGLLDKADENARAVITRFIGSLVDLSAYALEFAAD